MIPHRSTRMTNSVVRRLNPLSTSVTASVRISSKRSSNRMSCRVHQSGDPARAKSKIQMTRPDIATKAQNVPVPRNSRGSGSFSPEGLLRRPANRTPPIFTTRRSPIRPRSELGPAEPLAAPSITSGESASSEMFPPRNDPTWAYPGGSKLCAPLLEQLRAQRCRARSCWRVGDAGCLDSRW